MDSFTWSWTPLKLKKITNRSYGEFYHIQFPSVELANIACPSMSVAESDIPVTIMIKGDKMANLYADDDLFPYYEGVMLQDKRKVVSLVGTYTKIKVKGQKGAEDKFYLEFPLMGTGKKVKFSKSQYMLIMSFVGGESEKLKGFKVSLYGEMGRWFRSKSEPAIWAIRVDVNATAKENGLPVPAAYQGTNK